MRYLTLPLLLVALLAHVSAQGEMCSVCGEGLEVTLPDEIFSFPGQPSVQCGLLQSAGMTGGLPAGACPLLPSLIQSACGCAPITSTNVPATSAPAEPPCSVRVVWHDYHLASAGSTHTSEPEHEN